ncbi:MAG: hypothetical protein KJO60_16190, partial [Desulfofustis sp.]|nr:hypothetical protein [Desulfofustis sp.]
ISPQKLREKIFSILDRRQGYSGSMAHFELTGINTMLERLAQFRQPNSTSAAAPPEPAAVQP